MPNAGIVTFRNIFERATLSKNLTQSIFQSFTQMIKPVFRFSYLKELNKKKGSSAEKNESYNYK
jgi:hypothetical protein